MEEEKWIEPQLLNTFAGTRGYLSRATRDCPGTQDARVSLAHHLLPGHQRPVSRGTGGSYRETMAGLRAPTVSVVSSHPCLSL